MFDVRKFIKEGFIKAVGQMPEFKIRLNSAGWLDKGVLLEEDLAEINAKIEESRQEPIVINGELTEDIEEVVEENNEESEE